MKKAFSLIELLIVILIIGVVYTLSIGNFKNMKNGKDKLSLKNLRSYLQTIPYKKKIEFVCMDDCLHCEVFIDEKKHKKVKSFLDNSIKSYRYDFSYGMVELEKSRSRCFSYTLDKEGVGDQIFVEFQNKVYDMSAYLDDTPIYSSIDEVLDIKENMAQEVLR